MITVTIECYTPEEKLPDIAELVVAIWGDNENAYVEKAEYATKWFSIGGKELSTPDYWFRMPNLKQKNG